MNPLHYHTLWYVDMHTASEKGQSDSLYSYDKGQMLATDKGQDWSFQRLLHLNMG